jgi:hypothetical protein
MAFDYNTGMGQPSGAGSTSAGAKASQSGSDLVKNIRAGMQLGTVKVTKK